MADYFVHESSFVDDGVDIGTGTKIWHFCHIMSGAIIGSNCVIGQNVNIGGNAKVGNGVKIQNNVSVYDCVVLEDDVFCGPSCVFTNGVNPRSFISRKSEYQQTIVRKGTTLGANCTIVCGVVLGQYCFVGAGAVVTKNVPDFGLVYGNPATHRGWVSKAGIKLGEDLICPQTGKRYWLTDSGMAEAD